MVITPRMTAIQVSVMPAFLASGARKALTPFDTASIPVSVAQPEAKARRIMKIGKMPAPASCICSK